MNVKDQKPQSSMDFAIISAPLYDTKKQSDRLFPFVSQLNFGALSLASFLTANGISSRVLDPQHYSPDEWIDKTLSWLDQVMPKVIGVSCISGFSYPNFKHCIREIRRKFPEIPIIAGGKDHIGQIPESVMEECPELLLVVTGEGELVIEEIIKRLIGHQPGDLGDIPNVYTRHKAGGIREPVRHSSVQIQSLPALDYELYENSAMFPPSIEVSRGCPFTCEFCVNDAGRHFVKKAIPEIIHEVERIQKVYNDPEVLIYFQAPLFGMTKAELEDLQALKKERNLSFHWRAQSRVDKLNFDIIPLMAKAGSRILDLGLESCSSEILRRMGKTDNPSQYLSKAAAVLKQATSNGIRTKVNILFYIGEDRNSLLDTFNFLVEHSAYIHALSAYPVLVYPGGNFKDSIAPILKKFGGTFIEDERWNKLHLTPINPSAEFSYEDMQLIGRLFGKAFQTYDSYFADRKHGYYHPQIRFSDFINCLEQDFDKYLPCSKNRAEMLNARRVLERFLSSLTPLDSNNISELIDWD